MIKVLSTGSHGNCYFLHIQDKILILDCGITYRKILEELNYDLSKVIGCLVTHEHKDHCKAVKELLTNGIDIYTSKGTLEALGIEHHRAHVIKSEKQFNIKDVIILPFEVQHDVNEPLGFIIHHKATGKVLFATDTYYIKYKFKGLETILIECNYSSKILDDNVESGKVHKWLKKRVERSHFSVENLQDFFRSNDLSKVKNIILIHLSKDNGNPDFFKDEIEKVTGLPVIVATDGLEIGEGI